MRSYEVLEVDGPLAHIRFSDQYGTDTTAWSVTSLRKPSVCGICEGALRRGEGSYRPLTNGRYRMVRLHVRCVKAKA